MIFKSIKQASLGLIGFALLISTSMQANGVAPSGLHYTSYNISAGNNGIPFSSSVSLSDQFIGQSSRVFNLSRAEWLLTPTIKINQYNEVFVNHSPVHYIGYRVDPQQPAFYDYTVNVSNQFGYFTLNAFEPEYLLVPSYKIRATARGNSFIVTPITFADAIEGFEFGRQLSEFNHYLCYKTNVQNVSTTYYGRIYDQFRPRKGRPYQATMTSAHLCNPVVKSHDGTTTEIVDSNLHLMCFDLAEKFPYSRLHFAAANQFGRGKAAIYSDDELCLPSSKVIAPQDLCEDSLTNNGSCNGACPVQGNICVPNGNTGRCHCIVGPNN